jgi:rhomboid family GlyGly-CTERM serine protease
MTRGTRWTWIALAGAVVAGALLSGDQLELRRNAEVWRVVTCHFTHWSYEQLAWDALAFSFLGLACARRNRDAFHATLLASLVLVPLAVLAFTPSLSAYRGLSGLASAMFALLVTLEWTAQKSERPAAAAPWRWAILLCAAGFAAKLVFEAATGGTVFVDSMGANVVSVPVAHLAGALTGFLCAFVKRRPYTHAPCVSSWP